MAHGLRETGAKDSDLIIPAQPEQLDEADVRSLDDGALDDGALDDGALRNSALGNSALDEGLRLEQSAIDELVEGVFGPPVAIGVYSEDDEVVTQQVDAMSLEPRWLVQFSALDRRMMDTSEVISALIEGAIRRDTLVWRGGMDDWLPVGTLDLLAPSAMPTLPPERRTIKPTTLAPLHRTRPLEIALASLAIALSAATVTTSMLSIAGVFDSHEASGPTRVQALRAERSSAADDAEEAGEEGVEREVPGRPPAPDPERATAVAH